jgi:hypothetical protein
MTFRAHGKGALRVSAPRPLGGGMPTNFTPRCLMRSIKDKYYTPFTGVNRSHSRWHQRSLEELDRGSLGLCGGSLGYGP